MGELGLCVISDIVNAVKSQLLSDITTDVGVPLFFIRFLHNKVTYMIFFSSRCFFKYIDFNQFVFFASPFLLPFIFASFMLKPFKKFFLLSLFLFILFMIINFFNLNLGERIWFFQLFYMSLAVIGFVKIIRKILKKKTF